MPNPIGTWKLQGDWLDGTLIIESLHDNGNFTNVTLDGEHLLGLWDDASQKITFLGMVQMNLTVPQALERSSPVILSEAKDLAASRDRPFASLKVTLCD